MRDYVDALTGYPPAAVQAGIRHGLRLWKFRPTIAEIITEAVKFLPQSPAARSDQEPVIVLDEAERARRMAIAEAMPDGPGKRFALLACNPRNPE